MGYFKSLTRDQFQNKKGIESEILRFKGILKKAPYDKIIFHILFRLFHSTSRITGTI